MAYDQGLATRVRAALGDQPGLTDQQLFGGLAFLPGGNMVGPDRRAQDDDLRRWVDHGLAHAGSLPPKGP